MVRQRSRSSPTIIWQMGTTALLVRFGPDRSPPNYAGGSGTKSDPYQIATGEQLAKLVYGILSDPSSTQGKYYVITQNIRLNDTSAANWTKQATPWFIASNEQYCFKGTLDGAGHVVSGIYVDYNDYNHCYAALIPRNGTRCSD